MGIGSDRKRRRVLRAALAGAAAAGAWAAVEPLLGRAAGSDWSDVRLLGRTVTRSRAWPLAGLAVHVANGAAFGVAFERLGGRGWRQGILAAELENLVLWPAMMLVQRFHPDYRDHAPPLVRDVRVFAQEVAAHAVFGASLGVLLDERD